MVKGVFGKLAALVLLVVLSSSVFAQFQFPFMTEAPKTATQTTSQTQQTTASQPTQTVPVQGFGSGQAVETASVFGEKLAPIAVALPPSYPKEVPSEEMVIARMSEKVFGKFAPQDLLAMCPDEDKIVNTVYGYLESIKMTSEDICQPISDDLGKCNEAKTYCEKITAQGTLTVQEGVNLTCPPDEKNLASLCVERIKKQEQEQSTQMLEDIPLMCELEWEKNVGHFKRMCEDMQRSGQVTATQATEQPACPQTAQTDLIPEQKKACNEKNGKPEPVYKMGCLVAINCIERPICPQLPSPSSEFKESCVAKGSYITTIYGGDGCITGFACASEVPTLRTCPASTMPSDTDRTICSEKGGSFQPIFDSQGCPIRFECVFKSQQIVCPQSVPPSTEQDKDCTGKGGYLKANYDEKGCVTGFTCATGTAVKTCPQIAFPETDWKTCIEKGGSYEKSLDQYGCVIGYYCQQVIQTTQAVISCPPIKEISETDKLACYKQNGFYEKIYDQQGCVSSLYCKIPQQQQTTTVTQPACPQIETSHENKLACSEQGGAYQAIYDPNGCPSSYYCQFPTAIQTKAADWWKKSIYLQEVPTATATTTQTTVPSTPVPTVAQAVQTTRAPLIAPSTAAIKEFGADIYCSKESFVSSCIKTKQGEYASEFTSLNVEKICELETKLNIRQFKKFCTEQEKGKENCVKQADEGCKFIGEQLNKCKENATPENLKKMIKKKAHEACTFAKLSETTGNKLVTATNALGAIGSSVGGEVQPWLQGEQSRLINVTENVDKLAESDKQKDIVYQLTKLIGLQQQREKDDAAKLKEQITKLGQTIDSLKAVVEQIDDASLKASLQQQITDLEARKNELLASMQAKESGAAGIFSFLANLFGAAPQQPATP